MLPPVVDQVNRKAIMSDGKIATPIRFRHLRENYELAAGMHLDRTLVQSGGTAEVLIRPSLKMAGNIIDPASKPRFLYSSSVPRTSHFNAPKSEYQDGEITNFEILLVDADGKAWVVASEK